MDSLLTHKLLNESTTREVLSPKPELNSPAYGYGFFVNEDTMGHSGDGTGISTTLQHYKQSGYTLVILSNYSNPSAKKAYDAIHSALLLS